MGELQAVSSNLSQFFLNILFLSNQAKLRSTDPALGRNLKGVQIAPPGNVYLYMPAQDGRVVQTAELAARFGWLLLLALFALQPHIIAAPV